MNSLERKNLSFKNRKIPGIQNKEESISLNTNQSFNQNKLKFLNFVDKNTLMQNLDKNIKKVNNDQKNINVNNIPNKKIILNKLLLNQIKKENIKDSFNTRTNAHQIQTIEINNNLSINNISSYRSKIIINDNNNNRNKNTKKNFLMESHHLINSLLKNQNKIPKKEKANDLELSLYTTKAQEQKIKKEISPTKTKENKALNNSSFDNNFNNKENKDINLVKNNNKKEILISPLYNIDSNNININRSRMYRSPLRMADVLMLKKHHSINPTMNNININILTENNNNILTNDNLNRIKKITVIKNEKDINREKVLKENIKRIQNIKSNLIINDFKKENTNIENNIQEKNNIINENKFIGRNNLFDNNINKTITNYHINRPSINNIATISPIKDNNNNMKIKVNKIKLETIDEKKEINRTIHSIRRRFMNSKNKYNNNLSPDCIQRKITINENEPKEMKEEINNINNINIENNNNNIKNEEQENIPEIKFQSESEKENRIKRNKKYKYIKKEKETKERNINPSNKIKKYNSFSFGTLLSLSSKISQKKIISEINKKKKINQKKIPYQKLIEKIDILVLIKKN